MLDFATAKATAARLSALAEPTRLRIALELAQHPLHVGALAEALDVPMVNISHHLNVLRGTGLVEDERAGRRVVYRLTEVGDRGLRVGAVTVHFPCVVPPAT